MRYFSLFILILVISACKKEGSINCSYQEEVNYSMDTIKPSEYIMAYPGSYWVYDNGDTNYATGWEPSLVYRSTDNALGCAETRIDRCYLPRFNNRLLYQMDYMHTDSLGKSTTYTPVLREEIGLYASSSKHETNYSEVQTSEVIDILSVYNLNGTSYNDVIVVAELNVVTGHFDYINWKDTLYFARGVGMIQADYSGVLHSSKPLADRHIKLTNVYIAPH